MMEKNWVRFTRVRSPQQNYIGVLNFTIRTCTASRSKYRRQTGDARGVSSPVAAVYVVRPHHRSDELLRRIVQFVCGLGATEHAKVARIFFVNGFAERCGDAVHGLIPGSWTMRIVLTHQRLGQTAFGWNWHGVYSSS